MQCLQSYDAYLILIKMDKQQILQNKQAFVNPDGVNAQILNLSNIESLRMYMLSELKRLTTDKKTLYDLDIINIISEIKDIYGESAYVDNSSTIRHVIKVTLLAYYTYLKEILANKDKDSYDDGLDLCGKLVSAAVFHAAGIRDSVTIDRYGTESYNVYESRWEPDEIVCFLLSYCYKKDEDTIQELRVLNYSESFQLKVWDLYCILKESIAYIQQNEC